MSERRKSNICEGNVGVEFISCERRTGRNDNDDDGPDDPAICVPQTISEWKRTHCLIVRQTSIWTGTRCAGDGFHEVMVRR